MATGNPTGNTGSANNANTSGSATVVPTERDRRLIAGAVRHGRLVASQAWRWEWPTSPTITLARNRLHKLTAVSWLRHLPLLRGEGVYVPTPAGARLVADLTGGLAAPTLPAAHKRLWLGQLG
ncbi:MAG: hypothetical protein ACRDI2_21045, partial [Chloroflexota bacterium]